jgi:hypothetical protein
MADKPRPVQNASNYRSFDPVIIAAAGITALNLLYALSSVFSVGIVYGLFMSLNIVAMLLVILRVRTYATTVQTRVVRLEMWLRLRDVLNKDLADRARKELSVNQLAGLRFASDEELNDLTQAALAENLSKEDIIKRVKNWQPDWLRV